MSAPRMDATPGTVPAFLLYGSNKVLTRYPELYRTLKDRGLTPLVLTEPDEREGRLPQLMNDPSHLLSSIGEVGFHERDDLDGILHTVAQWTDRYSIAGGFSIGEYFVEASVVVNDYLGVPTPGLRAGRVCRNKHLQRVYLADFSPRSWMVTPKRRADDSALPDLADGVIKPVGRNSSSGVYRFTGRTDMRRHLCSYPDHEVLLVEEFVEGNEVSVEALVQHGKVIFSGITQKFVGDGFVEVGHEFPADLSPAHTRALLDANERILARLDFRDGISHAEFKITNEGEVRLMEIAARFPGDSIVGLYNLATGAALTTAIVDIALGYPAAHPEPVRHAKQVFVVPEPGTLTDVVAGGDLGTEVRWYDEAWMWPELLETSADAPPELRVIMCDKAVGDAVGEMENSFDRVLTFVVDAPTRRELREFATTVEAAIDVRTVP
ncbi:MAG: ATP-grasp domain-containing protein [Dermatophilaceae bacterium]